MDMFRVSVVLRATQLDVRKIAPICSGVAICVYGQEINILLTSEDIMKRSGKSLAINDTVANYDDINNMLWGTPQNEEGTIVNFINTSNVSTVRSLVVLPYQTLIDAVSTLPEFIDSDKENIITNVSRIPGGGETVFVECSRTKVSIILIYCPPFHIE